MPKRPDLVDITSITNSSTITAINQNWDRIQEAFDNTVSLDGSTPNAMNADLDINGNALLNVGTLDTENLTLNGQQITDLASVPEWRGAWVTATNYVKNDLVKINGNVYICLVSHSSGVFATDLTATRWELMVPKGDSGAGTGDLLSTSNLSDVADPATARANLGLGTVATENTVPVAKGGTGATDAAAARSALGVQAAGATLSSLEGLSLVEGDILYATAADTLARLPKGTAGQALQMNGGATAPTWVSAGSTAYTWQAIATNGSPGYDLTSIPAGVSEIIINFIGVSLTTKTDQTAIQIGDSGGIEETGYSTVTATMASGLAIGANFYDFCWLIGSSNDNISGNFYLTRRAGGNTWVGSGSCRRTITSPVVSAINTYSGIKTLSDTLTTIRISRIGSGNYNGGIFEIGYR